MSRAACSPAAAKGVQASVVPSIIRSSGSDGQHCQALQHLAPVHYLLVPLPPAEGLHQGLALCITCHNKNTHSPDLATPLLAEPVVRAARFRILHIAKRPSAGAVLPPNTAPMNICSGRVPGCCGFRVTLKVRSFASSCTATRQFTDNVIWQAETMEAFRCTEPDRGQDRLHLLHTVNCHCIQSTATALCSRTCVQVSLVVLLLQVEVGLGRQRCRNHHRGLDNCKVSIQACFRGARWLGFQSALQ